MNGVGLVFLVPCGQLVNNVPSSVDNHSVLSSHNILAWLRVSQSQSHPQLRLHVSILQPKQLREVTPVSFHLPPRIVACLYVVACATSDRQSQIPISLKNRKI